MKKRLLSILLCVCMILTFLPATALAATTVASGTCGYDGNGLAGDNLTWVLDSDGVLTISGTGGMKQCMSASGQPWREYSDQIRAVVIGEGVTDIGNAAFEDCDALESVDLPNSVTTIYAFAFNKCDNLKSITIPEGVTEIRGSVFTLCRNLTSVTLPSTVTSIGNNTFSVCEKLERITIPEGVTCIEGTTFYSCQSLAEVTIPKSVTSIGDQAFAECTELTDVYYGGSEKMWDTISVGTSNDKLTSAAIHYAITIGEYDATISTLNSTATVGDSITVSVNVTGNGTYDNFAAAEIELSYSGNISFDKDASTLNGAEVSDNNGIITLVDNGASQSLGSGVYTLAFTANAAGTGTITLVSAAFGTAEEAATKDLVEATCDTTPLSITIRPRVHTVSLPDIFAGAETVTNGEDYTFKPETATGTYYDYAQPTAEMGGVSVPVTANNDGGWTISDVTGDLVISGSRTAKQYDVTITGKTTSNDGTKAAYGTDYKFTLPTRVDAGLNKGYTYALESVTINDVTYDGCSANGNTYTIRGTDIVGDIEITITETELEPNKFYVYVSGEVGAAVGTFPATVDKGGSFTLTLNPEVGYEYTVTAEGYEVAANGNEHTISNITGNVTFVIAKSVITDNVSVSEYVKLNGTSMWLIKNKTEKLDGKLYTYSGENMFWSTEYEAYCILVVDTVMPTPTADKFAIITGTVEELAQRHDVNMTNTVDANDAQFIYNIYLAQYNGFDENVTMKKFMAADVNGDGKIDLTDAQAVVSFLLAQGVS